MCATVENPRRLAALAACSGCLLSRLELWGAVPVSGALAEALAGCCPHLACLCLDLSQSHVPQEGEASRAAAAECPNSVMQLLERCGPQLRALRLYGVRSLPPLSYDSLRVCTALAELELDAARCNPFTRFNPAYPRVDPGGSIG